MILPFSHCVIHYFELERTKKKLGELVNQSLIIITSKPKVFKKKIATIHGGN